MRRTPGTIKTGATQRYVALALILLWTAAVPGPTQAGGWDDYKPAKLTASIAKYELEFKGTETPQEASRIDILPGDPLRVTVRYLGKMRDIKTERRSFIIEMWGKAFGKDPDMLARTFQKEIQVQDSQKTYWLPIQNVLISHLKKEVAANGPVTLWVVFIGGLERNWVFLINEFQAP